MYSSKPRKSADIWLTSSAMKEICKCCRKDLGLISGNIALVKYSVPNKEVKYHLTEIDVGKCMSCRQKICTDCVISNLCHKCRVKRHITLNPKDLMKMPSKQLIEISSTLHFHNPQGYEKSELVQLILAIYGCKWKRPIPQQPGIIDDVPTACVLCETEPIYMHLVFCQRCTAMLNQPEFLMNLPGRQLQCILKLLKIPEQEMKGREKGDLVTLVLNSIGNSTVWKPPLPQQPSTSNPQHGTSSKPIANFGESENDLRNTSENSSPLPQEPESSSPINNAQIESVTTTGNDDDAERRFEADQHFPPLAHVEHARDITDEVSIQQLKIYQLKSVLRSLGEETNGLCERKELVDRVTELWRTWKARNELKDMVENSEPIGMEEMSNEPNAVEVEEEAVASNVSEGRSQIVFARDVPPLNSLVSEEAIKALSVRQLKMILQKHSVNYTGCRERNELADKVINLWKDNRKRVESGDVTDDDLCKICMDAPIDCVLLECAHMVACTECGRQMSECPVCRQYVIRVVHTFRV